MAKLSNCLWCSLNMSMNEKGKEVEEKIRNWLLEEGFKVKLLSNEHASFNFLAEDQEGRKVNIIQLIKDKDKILIVTKASLLEEQKQKLMKLDSETRNRILWTLRFGLLNREIGFSGIGVPLESITLSMSLYYDGMSKDKFMHRLLEVRKALLFVMWLVDRELGEPEPTVKLPYID